MLKLIEKADEIDKNIETSDIEITNVTQKQIEKTDIVAKLTQQTKHKPFKRKIYQDTAEIPKVHKIYVKDKNWHKFFFLADDIDLKKKSVVDKKQAIIRLRAWFRYKGLKPNNNDYDAVKGQLNEAYKNKTELLAKPLSASKLYR